MAWKRACRYLLLIPLTAFPGAAAARQNATMASLPHPALSPDEAAPSAQLPAAEAGLRVELGKAPDSPELLYRLAQVLREEQKPRESLTVYTQAAQRQKPTAEQLRSVALDYVQLGDYDDAVHWLKIALGIEPHNVAVLYSLGRCLYTQNHFEEAAAAFLAVLKLEPAHRKAEENLGLTWYALHRLPEAEAAMRTAVKLAGDAAASSPADSSAPDRAASDPWPYLNLGSFLIDQQRYGEAMPFLQKAITIAPQMAAPHEKLGEAWIGAGKRAEGTKELEMAQTLDPKNPQIHFELGRAYWSAGEKEKARAEFAQSQSLYGTHSKTD
ncbi:hypothetical protein GCM10011586_25980 [Silvibacterium dinghuense]|nr:hypothetical protein GCM10011586_25980 [Silvibacterium dinghuense]